MNELKKCPFCGGEIKQMFLNPETYLDCVWDESVGNVSTWFKCYECDSEFFHDEPIEAPEKQVEWWNTRKPADDVVEAFKNASYAAKCLTATVDYLNLDKAIEIVKEHLT